MKSDFKAVKEKVEDTVEQLEKWAETGDNLPERVHSTHSKVVHANIAYLSSLSTFFLEDEMPMALPLQPLCVREGQRGGDMCQMQGRAIAER